MKPYRSVFVTAGFFIINVIIAFISFNGEKPSEITDVEYDISAEKEQNEDSGIAGSESGGSEVRIKTAEGYHELYRIMSATYGYTEDGLFAADTGPRLHNLIGHEDISLLPIITWDEGFSIDAPEDIDILSIDCITAEGKNVFGLYEDAVKKAGVEIIEKGLENYKDYFSKLPRGEYYVAVEVYRQGRYIETEHEYEYSIEQYAFCLDFSGS